jgi:hypothetical protein
MKFKIEVAYADGSGTPWTEECDERRVESINDALDYGRKLIDDYNAGLRCKEKARKFISAQMTGEQSEKHEWEKSNLVTIVKGGSNYDTGKCKVCGITSKRYGLGGGHSIDN